MTSSVVLVISIKNMLLEHELAKGHFLTTLIGIGLGNHLQKNFLEKSNDSNVQSEFPIFYQKTAKIAKPKNFDFCVNGLSNKPIVHSRGVSRGRV